jgi:peptidoglycan/xylan/chitin deacetylase (PgdA/CDA1 family)
MNKQKLSLLVKKVFLRTGVYGFIRIFFPNRKLAILRYHSIVKPQDNFYTSPAIALSPVEFEKQVRYFAKKYTVLSLDQVVDYLREKKPLPQNSVVFTFDDGYLDNLESARTLKKYGVNGTFFITTEPIGRESTFWLSEVTYLILKTPKNFFIIQNGEKEIHFSLTVKGSRWKAIREIVRLIKSNNRTVRENVRKQLLDQLGDCSLLPQVKNLILTWEQVRQMKDMGMIFGSHTLTHLNLPNADPEDAKMEISASKKVLEDKLGCKIRHFSYPNSGPYEYFNEQIRQYVIDSEYDSSCTSNNGFVDHNSDFFALERVRTVPDLEEVVHGMEWDRLFSR